MHTDYGDAGTKIRYGASLGGQKYRKGNFYEFLQCPFIALGPQFHKNRDILEVVHYNDKLLY